MRVTIPTMRSQVEARTYTPLKDVIEGCVKENLVTLGFEGERKSLSGLISCPRVTFGDIDSANLFNRISPGVVSVNKTGSRVEAEISRRRTAVAWMPPASDEYDLWLSDKHGESRLFPLPHPYVSEKGLPYLNVRQEQGYPLRFSRDRFPWDRIAWGLDGEKGDEQVLLIVETIGLPGFKLAPLSLPREWKNAVGGDRKLMFTPDETSFRQLQAKFDSLPLYNGPRKVAENTRVAEMQTGGKKIGITTVSGDNRLEVIVNMTPEEMESFWIGYESRFKERVHPFHHLSGRREFADRLILRLRLENGGLVASASGVVIDRLILRPVEGEQRSIEAEVFRAISDSILEPVSVVESNTYQDYDSGNYSSSTFRGSYLDSGIGSRRDSLMGRGDQPKASEVVEQVIIEPRKPGVPKVYADSKPRYSKTKSKRREEQINAKKGSAKNKKRLNIT